jgi:hypothetical protein
MSQDMIDLESYLSVSGVPVAGTVHPSLIQNTQRHLEAQNVTRRVSRETRLQWNDDCDAIAASFESVSNKSESYTLRGTHVTDSARVSPVTPIIEISSGGRLSYCFRR